MAPKAAKKPDAAPAIEEEVVLPPGVECEDPPFLVSVVHIVGHVFSVEGEAPEPGTPGPLSEFDTAGALAGKLRETAADVPNRVVVERADLEALLEGGGAAAKKAPAKKGEPVEVEEPSGPSGLAKSLLKLMANESLGRRRQKVNAARRRAIALSSEAVAKDEAAGSKEPVGSKEPPAEQPTKGSKETARSKEAAATEPDLVLMLFGYPTSAEHVQELVEDNVFGELCSWVSLYLAGETATETEEGRKRQVCESPPEMAELFQLVRSAPLGTPLANCSVRTVAGCHSLALPAEGAPERLLEAALEAVNEEIGLRFRYTHWLEGTERVGGMDGALEGVDTRLYARLADAVQPVRQDVPLLLHCMCEQVALNLSGDAAPDLSFGQDEAGRPTGGPQEEVTQLEACLDGLHADLCTADIGPRWGPKGVPEDAWDNHPPEVVGDDDMMLPYFDRASCRHPNGELPGGESEAAAISTLLSRCCAIGVNRAGLPAQPEFTTSQRSALRARLHAFVPEDVPLVEVERLYILEEFTRLLEKAQPERKWSLTDRVVHERIQSSLLVQAMSAAAHDEGFVDTVYLPRHDCLLVAMHQRLLPGRVLWHSWMGDFLQPGAPPELLRPTPTFADWRWKASSSSSSDPDAAPRLLQGCDARECGYCSLVEKVLTPADRSAILQTVLRRGLRDSMPPPGSAGFEPHPASCRTFTRIIKGRLAFGMTTDDSWGKKVARFRAQREEEERAMLAAEEEARRIAEEKAAADAARVAQGLPEQEEEAAGAPPEEARASPASAISVSERRLEDLQFGSFWLTFPDSSRCTFRAQHEKPWWRDGALIYDVTFGRPGVQLSYSTASGLLVQLLPDATVRQSWPSSPPVTGLAEPAESSMRPGCPLDGEVSRTVSPFGVLVRELLSGRREVYHPDGTCATRNPTVAELRAQLDVRRHDGIRRSSFEMLESMIEAYEQSHGSGDLEERPTEEAKFAGLPGHWRIVRPDGLVIGRVAAPPPVEADAAPAPTAEGDGEAGEAQASKEAPEASKEASAAPSKEASVADPPGPSLQELLDGWLVEGGAVIEYDIGNVPTSSLVDPHTGQKTIGNAESLLVVEGSQGTTRTCMLGDGTRIFWARTPEGHTVTVEKDGLARVVAKLLPQAYHPKEATTCTEVECADGTRLQVVPQRLNERGELVMSHPKMGQCPEFCTNAQIFLRRPDGMVLHSKGDGDVYMASALEVAALGEREALLTVAESGAYLIHCDGDFIGMKDADGNQFEIRGDQSVDVALAVAMGDGHDEPACEEPGRPYRHPDAKFLPLPDGVPPPRLFVVYGDGEAEEILPATEVQEALRIAREDPSTLLLEGEPMGFPMDSCKSHTMYRTVSLDPTLVPPTPVVLPPTMAGFEASAAPPPHTFTELRQFVEYPAVSDAKWQGFQEALALYRQEEERHRLLHESYGAGLKGGRRLMADTVVGTATVAEAGA